MHSAGPSDVPLRRVDYLLWGSPPIELAPGFTRQRAVSCVSGSQVSLVGWHSSLRHEVFHPEEVAAVALLRELKLMVRAVAEALGVQLNRPAGQGRLGRRRPRWAWGPPHITRLAVYAYSRSGPGATEALVDVAFQHRGPCRHGTRVVPHWRLSSETGSGGCCFTCDCGWGGAAELLWR